MQARFEEEERQLQQLTWLEAPGTELVRLAWPITVSMLSYSVMTLVDTLFVGRIGAAALAAVGLGGIVAFTLLCFPMGLLTGVKVLVSQAVGAGRNDRAPRFLMAGLTIALLMGLLVVALGQLVAALLPAVMATEAAGSFAQQYLAIRSLGGPAFLVFTAIREYRLGKSEAQWPMYAALAANAANIGLDWLLIVELDFSVAGAAWATVGASFLQALILALAPPKLELSRRLGDWLAALREVWSIGVPSGLQFLLEIGSFTAMSLMIAAYGERDMAAHQIALQVIHIGFLPGVAVSDAASILTGQAVGARRMELVKRVAHRGLLMAGGYAVLCTVALALGSRAIAAGFTSEPDLLEQAASLLTIAACFQICDAANIVARGALRGTGDVRYTAIVGIVTAWVLTPPLTWLLCFGADLGAIGGWLAICAEILLGALIFWTRIERGGWLAAAERTRSNVA